MKTTPDTQSIWHFDDPPIAEVVCGVQFKPLRRFAVSHFGQLWERFKPDGYVTCQDTSPLFPVVERFDNALPENAVEIPDPLLPRVWFLHQDGTGIVQVQRDRFLHNWKKSSAQSDYPHYYEVKQKFHERYETFVRFLSDNEIGELEPSQYEMTYVNHIPQGAGWDDLRDLGRVFPDFVWRGSAGRFLSRPSACNLSVSFDLPEKTARLHTNIRSGIRRDDRRPLLLFELTVRGLPDDLSPAAMLRWFDVAREWIVRSFDDLTGDEVQKRYWRKMT